MYSNRFLIPSCNGQDNGSDQTETNCDSSVDVAEGNFNDDFIFNDYNLDISINCKNKNDNEESIDNLHFQNVAAFFLRLECG